MTLLYDYGYTGDNGSYRIAYIEISTSSGTKRGYVYNDQLDNVSYNTSVARVITSSSTYSGPDSAYVKIGGAYYNEFVSIIAKEGDCAFIEYNTTSGRKRAYINYSKLYNYNYPGWYNDFATNQGLYRATSKLNVYGGPDADNANIGTIFNNEVVSLLAIERGYAYIEYTTVNGAKRGYVLSSSLVATSAPTIPKLPTYSNFTSGIYGTSGLGQELKYYKIGNGSNVAFAVFAQHGWEDAWAYDGIELVNIANRVMQNLSSTGVNSNWTLYIIPYANPDGITNGYTNNGPGRCTVTTKIDMNRSWPAKFQPSYTSRNYTGDSSLASPEGLALKNFIISNIGNNEKIILDIHGWYSETNGNNIIGQYFDEQFGISHKNYYGNGFLETWGASIGAKSCLIELPMPSSSQDIINRDFSGKLSNGIRNMLNGASVEGGEEVYELVHVINSNYVNVRSGPGTNYSLVGSLLNDTTAIRIRKNVATANGYIWDKIRLNDGTEGYVANYYLELHRNIVDYPIDNYIFTLNKTESDLRPQTTQTISIGESEYAAMDAFVIEEKLEELEIAQIKLNTLCIAGLALDTAGPSLKRFQSNSGTFLHHSRAFDLFNTSPVAINKLNSLQNAAIKATEQMSLGRSQFNFALSKEDSMELENVNVMNQSITELIDNYITNIEKLDWFLAYGKTRIELICTVEKVNNKTILTTTYNLNDYYDWNKEGTEKMFKLISQQELWQLHNAGLARNFQQEATYVRVLEWDTGNTSTAKVVSEFSK